MEPAAPSSPRQASAQDAVAGMQSLQQLRDALRSRLPGATAEQQQRFATLDRQLRDLETAAQATGTAATALIRTLLHGFHALGDALRPGGPKAAAPSREG